jgi:beta-lactamase regulating signal transducer with metallopeptidase domain
MGLYILKFSACLAILLLFYKVALERENMHVQKRFYLLFALATSFIVPLITYKTYIEVTSNDSFVINNLTVSEASDSNFILDNLSIILYSIYIIGTLIFGIRFYRHLYQIIQRIKKNEKYIHQNFINVLMNDVLTPHTFFKYIFLNKDQYESQSIPQEVFWHEQTHASQKHSVDILIIEFIQVLFWFNPLIYWIKNAIKLNHEFLADQAVLNKGINAIDYQYTLLNFTSGAARPQLVNALNYSLIKKRFTVMKSPSSKRREGLRYALLLPLLALLFFSFRTESVVEIDKEAIFENSVFVEQKQEGATKAQVDEYNALAKKLHYTEDRNDEYIIKKKDVERLKYLYGLMSDSQKQKAHPFPTITPPPPPASSPKKPRVKELPPPPPPPLPDNPTDTQVKKHKEMLQLHKEKLKYIEEKEAQRAEKVKLEKIKIKEEKLKKQEVKLKRINEKKKAEQAVLLEREQKAHIAARLAQVEERKYAMALRKEAKVAERVARSEKLAATIAARKEAMEAERMARSEGQRVAIADKKRALEAVGLARSKDRMAARAEGNAQRKEALADRKAAQGIAREIMRAERAELAKIRKERLRENPGEFVDKLSNDGAVFYYNDNKIQSDRAKRLLKNKEGMSVDIERNSGGKTRVYLSDE